MYCSRQISKHFVKCQYFFNGWRITIDSDLILLNLDGIVKLRQSINEVLLLQTKNT